jgi:sialidase-1
MINQTLSKFATHQNSAYPHLWRGCVGAWCMSLGPSGSRLFDYSRRNQWGTLTNMDPATDWVVDKGAYALDFDGTNDNVTTLSTFSPGAGAMTCCYWFDGRSTAQYNAHIAQRPASFNSSVNSTWVIGNGNYNVAPNNTLRIGVLWYTPGAYRVVLTDNGYNNGWRHYAVVNTGAAIIVYVDGVLAPSVTTSVGGWPNVPATSAVAIGGAQDGTLATTGAIDDVRLYDRALSVAELQILARRRGIAFTPRTRRLAAIEQAAGGATPWLYARRMSRIIGGGVS